MEMMAEVGVRLQLGMRLQLGIFRYKEVVGLDTMCFIHSYVRSMSLTVSHNYYNLVMGD